MELERLDHDPALPAGWYLVRYQNEPPWRQEAIGPFDSHAAACSAYTARHLLDRAICDYGRALPGGLRARVATWEGWGAEFPELAGSYGNPVV